MEWGCASTPQSPAPTPQPHRRKLFPPSRQTNPGLCHPERTRISYFTAHTGGTYVVLSKENHTQPTEAATLDRKSGEAEGSAVRPLGRPEFPVTNPKPQTEVSSRPERSEVEGPAVPRIHKPISTGGAALPFVIPSEAEGSQCAPRPSRIPRNKP